MLLMMFTAKAKPEGGGGIKDWEGQRWLVDIKEKKKRIFIADGWLKSRLFRIYQHNLLG